MLQRGHTLRLVSPLPYKWRSQAVGPCYKPRSSTCFAGASLSHAQHKDIENVVFTEETIRERIAVMGRCAVIVVPARLTLEPYLSWMLH